MKIGILGAGSIGTTLARKLAAAGHFVKVANSRGPETVDLHALATGAQAATAEAAANGVEVLILSMPHAGFAEAKLLVTPLPAQTSVIDTSNYFPNGIGSILRLSLAPSRASGSRTSSAGPLSKHGTPSLRRLLPSAADHRDIPDASPSLSPPTVPVTGKWQWHW
ncbi:NAD(P)-binding domain-containing protein [Xanthomonas euroxanthea]